MSAPPPPQPPPFAGDDFYDDDGFDWDAAVREIDEACALASASASAPAPAPVHHPLPPRPPEPSATAPLHRPPAAGGGAARQSTLDRFVDSFTKRRQEKERPAPPPPAAAAVEPGGGGVGRPGAGASEGCSRQAGEKAVEDRFLESFTRRQREKEGAAPAAPAGGRKRPAARASKGCPRRTNVEVELDPCAVALDHEAVQTWIYPTNVEIREYQKYMVEKALFTNTLIALPTGLGKTFIAAVVMYNYFRWFPEGKIIFAAPSRPLVAQQIEACHNTVGIPQLLAAHVPLRILALTATPGSKHAGIQSVINNLCISELIYCDEEDSLVKQYVNTRKVHVVTVPFGSDVTQVDDMLSDIVRPHLNRLRDAGVIDYRDYARWTPYELMKYKDKFKEAPPPNICEVERGQIGRSFVALGSLFHMRKLLLSHGIQQARQFLEEKLKNGSLNLMRKNELFWQVKEKMKFVSSQGSTPKIKELIKLMVQHFSTDCLDADKTDSKDSRVIIFSHFRGSVNEIYCSLQNIDDNLIRPVEFIGQSSAGDELIGYRKKQGDSRTMRKLLRNSSRFEYHASPRMVPHVYKPEAKYVKLTIDKYIPSLNKMRVAVKEASPIPWKMSEADGQLIAQYFGACKEDVWRPSLVAFPRFQLYPSLVHKVPHSFRTTDMLTDAMQQLQDPSCFRAKCEKPLEEPADVAAGKGQEHEGFYAAKGNEAVPYECDGLEDLSRVARNQSVSVPGSPVKKYPIHSFFSGDYVTVDRAGNVSITFVPVLPQTSAFHKDTKNADWHRKDQNKATPYISVADVSWTTVEFVCPVTNSGKHMSMNNLSSSAMHSPKYAGPCNNVDDSHVLTPLPPITLTSPRGILDTTCNTKVPQSTSSYQEDMELSPRLTLYMEEGIVPESPALEVSHLHLEIDGAANVGFVPKGASPDSLGVGTHTNLTGCKKGLLDFDKNGQSLSVVAELGVSSRQNVLDHTRAKREEPTRPSNVKMYTPTKHTPTGNLLHDSFSGDCLLRSGGDASGSVQQAPKYRRLCKYGDKIKRVSISFDACRDGFEKCDIAARAMSNQIEHATGKKGKAQRRLDTFIDEEVEVSEDDDVSEDEDDNQSEDKYEDSFIDDQATPTVEFTQTEQGGRNNGDMMGFYRQSLLTQSPVFLPSRYLDVSDNSASMTGNASCSSEVGHNSMETPKELQTHNSMNPSPSYQQSSLGRASFVQDQCETTIANCESSTKLDCRKRKLSFQQPAVIPVINLEPVPEPAPQASAHIATGVTDDIYYDDAFFEGLDLDTIEAEATELWRQKTTQSTQKPVETKKASELSFAPPSFDLGF
ncbi:Fanconi anemia group M protein [Dichanthelium oligosanthes]|uniref:Fanconi anemia group M protein n=1 Tax=Dichanthelium oligosanthes TaxID=888268 RepID=A0A1E5UK18_9POAL|nr:Fanconi anemia group M protein [Dichanthelium oligosanthes]